MTHDVAEAVELGHRIGLMEDGRFLQVGTPFELLFKPASPAVSSYFSNARVECELRTITINDLLPFLPGIELRDEVASGPSHSVFQTLRVLNGSPDGGVASSYWTGLLTEAAVLQALGAFKKSLESRS